MKKSSITLFICATLMLSCDYLDLVPDDVATIDMIFSTRNNAEKMLTTCYTYMPAHASVYENPGMGAGDEVWNSMETTAYYSNSTSFNIAKGNQNANNPYLNYWSGGNDGYNMFLALRDCNIMIENIDRVPDMTVAEKERWKAEVMVLKAYYHFWMMNLYGPIPFVDESIDITADLKDMLVEREPVDVVVEKIVKLLDDAIDSGGLPESIRVQDTELGRVTSTIARAIKAKVLVYAASPLFNGNPDYPNYVNRSGVPLINPVQDDSKWVRAAEACREAIDAAHSVGHALYEFDEIINVDISDVTRLELTLRHTITSRFNRELIWGCGNNFTTTLMGIANAPLTAYHQGQQISWCKTMHSPTLDVAEQFYSKNGVPIEEDRNYDYDNRYKVSDVPADHLYYLQTGARTANLSMNREPRFYAYLGFDKGKWFNEEVSTDRDSYVVQNKANETAGMQLPNYSVTGYFAKKLVSYKLVMTESTHTGNNMSYAFPIIRLADLYLMYAEALNETKSSPDAEVYEYIQKVRDKAGLDTDTGSLVDTWAAYSNNPSAPTTKAGMRNIIRRERLIELAFEGHRFNDLRRWRLATEYMSRPIRGWNVLETEESSYYQVINIHQRKFTPRDYFWPIKISDLYVNKNLIQSPLW